MSRIKRQLRYNIFPEEDVFVARCLEVEVASDGHTEAAAVANLREALAVYFDEPASSFSLALEQDVHRGD
ncbi:MAG: HicB family protein [Betaproteobacteria bacterium HGW-Betaproteobacteria-12]|nr:MAG: HicB family protein [Betaproteobacteria bacterium HGW-Betaproteobacteria-12]